MPLVINTKLARFAAELHDSYTQLVSKYWDDGLEYFDGLDIRVYTDDIQVLGFYEEGIEFYPVETK